MKTIVEVGAAEGVKTQELLKEGNVVYSFEPHEASFKILGEKFGAHSRLTLLPFAVDIGDNQEPLFEHPNGMHTLQPDYFNHRQQFKMVWTMRLDTFMNLYNLVGISFLSIDAPFREEMILESLGNRFKDVQEGSVRFYDDNKLVPKLLQDQGFSLRGTTNLYFWRE